ncbi:Periplasmic thiol disulfide interchange protein DsbA [Enhygromyxa salina]|uniref:Periplasmic thiol disulfide interchange protein DsbA n=1 Tax=Enhygromyxa salina TaxID=215803 RepID=A0A0C2CZD2_9BACT|nr:thioredoxin domain-containing protein [Enhygromyxa salina]KIG15010.1 Periplasmic thiol disulfide interchange protein DsbA [Enhygromyxa salina]
MSEDDKQENEPDTAPDTDDQPDQTIEESSLLERKDAADDEPEVAAAKPAKSDTAGGAGDKRSKLLGNLVFVLGFLATLVLGYFVGQWVRVKFGDKPVPETGDRYHVELRGDEPQQGPDDALVTIIEFADYQCPYCAQSVEPLADAMSGYEGDVRLIFKHYPLPGHRAAAPAAYTSWAAHQQGDFWVFHDRLFEAKASIEQVPEWVKERGLDASKFGQDMESPEAKAAVDSDMLAGSKVGVTGTPAFFVNGHLYRGKRSAIDWKKIIEAELDYAKEVVDDGVPRGELYAHLMKDALEHQVGAPTGPPKAKRERRAGEPDDTSVYKIPIEGRPVKGPHTALVTVVELADYHCPYCSKVKTDLDRLLEAHPDEVRLVYIQRPLTSLHPKAREASKAALAAAQQGKFWEMHEKLFLRQLTSMQQFEKVAEELGLDLEQFKADFDSELINKQLLEDQQLADRFGVNGTPAFFINGRYVSGALGYQAFEALFQEHLAEAKQMVANGTAPSEVYGKLMAAAKTTVD